MIDKIAPYPYNMVMIKSLDKAIQIMNIVATPSDKLPTLKNISTITEINKSTCVRIIDTLIKNGLLVKISASKGYILGPRAYLWTNNGRFMDSFVNAIKPVLRWLNKKLNRTIIFATVINGKKYIIDIYEAESKIFSTDSSIREDNFFNSATGILLLANLDKEELFKIYSTQENLPAQLGVSHITTFNEFLKFLSNIRRDRAIKHINPIGTNGTDYLSIGYGHLIKLGYKIYGAIGVALKIENGDTISEDEEQNIVKHLKIAAKEIENRILNEEASQ